MFAKVAVAGTFDSIHAGHELLLEKALSSGRRVLLGLCGDEFAGRVKGKKVRAYSARKRALLSFFGKQAGRVEIAKLEDPFGPALTDSALGAIVVSTETEPRAVELNEKRKSRGLGQLKIISIPLIYAQDLSKISSRRVRAGATTSAGKLLRPVVIAVGSVNPTKVGGVRRIAEKIFPKLKILGITADSGVPSQPFADETIAGAVNRAMVAKKRANADYGVGLESGLFPFYGRHLDIQWCAVFDGENVTLGNSMGFEVPEPVVDRLKKGKEDMAQVFEELAGIRGIGKKGGAIAFLSGGMAERRSMSEQAFLCAMIPRLNRAGYKRKAYK